MRSTNARDAPPKRLRGLDGVWILIDADALVFALLFGMFMQERMQNADFESSRLTSNVALGGLNTRILLTSSLLVVLAIHALNGGVHFAKAVEALEF
ncbi:hypothetical protein [Mycolicibacterium hodleri]|uniref:Uncharacterized protein n=1 Tax=Mycolicibacterium hodleri TaxID=49897 RepID=A0A502EFH5_9MYCO|nr:hypothetical protein [Mycolicibacterium hodleri]TPG36475.1 hypothetical protein EAH80_00400 [Mycolicibacterium hodleri]